MDDVAAQAFCAHLSLCSDCAREVDRERNLILAIGNGAILQMLTDHRRYLIYKCDPVVIS